MENCTYYNGYYGEVPFAERNGSSVTYHGRIAEIDHCESFNGKWHKIFNSIVRGEPYQFAHQTREYTIRIENITDGYSTETTDLCLYGNYLGRLQVGDEIVARTKSSCGRRIVRSLYNETTGSKVSPGLQIPSGIVRLSAGMTGVIAASIIAGIVWLVKSGTLAAWFSSLITLICSLLPLVILFLIFTSGNGSRRRRR